jgi:hypothetical protein
MMQHTANRIAAMMDKATRAGLIATAGRDDEYGRDWWDIVDPSTHGGVLHIRVKYDADGMGVSIHEGGEGRMTSLADAERTASAHYRFGEVAA